ncbi:MAG: hypothetical protein LBG31_05635, partial [Prevotellaceae bacterium]|nr:hypothetical protein [Prevotellaceae bacterium]
MIRKLFIIAIGLFSGLPVYAQDAGNQSPLLAEVEQLQAKYEKDVNAAFAIADAVQKAGAYVESLTALFENGEIPLPVGIKSKEAGYALIVEKITHDEQTGKAVIHASCAFEFKESGQRIAFAGEVALEGQNGLGTEGFLELVAPVRRNMGKAVAIVIREGTKVKFGCNGIESFDAKLACSITSETIVAVRSNGAPTNKPLEFSFDATFQDFDSYLLSLNIDQSFSIKGLKDVIFTLKGATLDQSDVETSSMTKFPENYFASGSADEIKLWKGLSVSEASVSLPAFFKNPDSTGRVTIALQQVLLDGHGFTGNVSATDIINSATLPPDQWGISLNDFSLGIMKNNIASVGFGGEVNIPPLGKHSLLPYTATFNPAVETYEFKVNFKGKYDFPALKSAIELNELSSIEILIKESDFYPSLHASGTLTINAPIGSDTNKTFSVPGISFENMVISRESPYFQLGAVGITGKLATPKIAGFELSIGDIHTVESAKGTGLAFEAGVALNETFSGAVGLQLYGDTQKWKFRELNVGKVRVKYESGAFSLDGGVEFKNGDALYGDGFRGDVKLKLIDKFELEAVSVFGKKDDYRYFLTDVFLELLPQAGIPLPPALSFYGFGGGLYTRMQQASKLPQPVANIDSEFGKALSGITYVPDREVGLGFMATTKFALQGSPNAFNAKVGFEMQFNRHGGLNFVQFRGDVSVMDIPDKWGKLTDNIKKSMEKLEKSGITQPKKASRDDISPPPENKSSGFLTASINIEYDLIHSVFSADMNAYLNAGVIKGAGENDRLGWSAAYFSPEKWYLRVGTPSDRVGVEALGMAKLTSYFMAGHDIPGLPLPPEKVLRNLSPDKQNKLQRTGTDKLTFGKGLAFGAGLEVSFDATFPPFYAHLGAGIGSEFLLVDLRGRTCSNYSGIPGINGWYAQVQAWAYVEAAIGIGVKLFGKQKKFDILDISVGALLQGAGPNPMYFAGAVGGRFRVLGGLISGNCSFDFEMGEKCILSGGSPFDEEVISGLTPISGEKDVNVFATPQALFNIPVEVEMTVEEEDTKGTYKVTLEEFSVKYTGTNVEVTGQKKLSDDGKVCVIDPEDPFESQKDMEVYAKVGFKKKINNNWVYVTGNDGKPVFEERKESFHSGDRPKEILPEHVKYSYPVNRQYNFYPDEYRQGYIRVAENYEYLFTTEKPEGFEQVIRISDVTGRAYEKPFTFHSNSAGNDVRFEIDFSMEQLPFAGNQIYKLAIVNVPQTVTTDITGNISTVTTAVEGAGEVAVTKQQATGDLVQLNEKEIYALNFRSSSYKTFVEKMQAIPVDKAVALQEYPYVYRLISNIYDYASPAEVFDAAEIAPVNPAQRLVAVEPVYEKTAWYTGEVEPLIYHSRVLEDAGLTGKTPDRENATYYATNTSPGELSEAMIETNTRYSISPWG